MRPPLSARDLVAASARDGPIELIWSDAMWEPSSSRPAQGGFVVLAPEEPGKGKARNQNPFSLTHCPFFPD